jgi:glutamine kinase
MKEMLMGCCKFNKESKFRTLELLMRERLQFSIPKLFSFSAKDYNTITSDVNSNIVRVIKSNNLVVRSSAADEDGEFNSSAGEYESVLNIPSDNFEKITDAINTVIASYEKKRQIQPEDEVIIQEMVQNTSMSGVIFTHDLNTGAPYYVINYDDESGLTDTVTSGGGEYANRTLYIHRNSINALRSDRFTKLLLAVQELERVMKSQFLDIEFALSKDLTPYLLQVRAITTQPNWNRAVTMRIDATLQGVQSFVTERLKKICGVYGETTVLGQMPDWNPVEMIGRAPRALATSLYQTLITDHAWRTARETMGYSVPIGQPLMVLLAGQPFIDTRLSFHSYLPKTLSPAIADKLVSRWIDHLKSCPALHDKVEFEVAITTFSFDMDEKIEQLIGGALSAAEKEKFKQAHLKQARYLLKGEGSGSLSQALNKINALNDKHTEASKSNLQHNLSSLFKMVDDCIHLGTVPFSILARHGFIAKTILISLISRSVITHDEANRIQASVVTVASELVDDMRSHQMGTLSNSEFMARYGHLRPGTYDIMSQRYDQMTGLTGITATHHPDRHAELFEFSKNQQQKINILLAEEGFEELNADNLLNYIREATIGREYSKFVFTRSVSDMLEIIAIFGEEHGLSRDEMSHIPVDALLNVAKNSGEGTVEEQLRKISEKEAEKHDISVAIRLPQLLTDEAGVHIVPFQVSHPNFITHKKITAPFVVLHSADDVVSLSGKVIIIEGADPGYDWIFLQKIVGLITKYGGANSHMAIRCAEFGIPAAIGCGEQRFDLLLRSNQVHLDCAAGLINPLH